MIIEITDHLFTLTGHLEVCLSEVVATRSLKSVLTPHASRLRDRIVQSRLVEDLMDGCVAYQVDLAVILQVAFYSAWTPISLSSKFQD